MKKPCTFRRSICVLTFLCLLTALAPAALCQTAQDCLMCHSNNGLTMSKGGKTTSIFVDAAKFKGSVHAMFSCVDCHVGLSMSDIPHAKVIKPVNCRKCHETPNFENSIHGVVSDCKSCHGSHDILSVKDAKSVVSKGNVSGTCGKCHEEELRQFSDSAHRNVLTSRDSKSPTCTGCHGAHNIVPGESRKNEAAICLKCHLNNPDILKQVGYSPAFMAGYSKSVHGAALAAGNQKAATCSDCHGAHDLKKASDAASMVNQRNMAQTCSRCHSEIGTIYKESVHGTALARGNMDSPTCTSCHGEHEIYGPRDSRSRVAPSNVSVQVCGSCHNSVQLSQKYGLPSQQFNSFQDSYHGLAARAGSVEVANCASCHGVHNIKPSSDPASTVNKANLAATCGQCHPGAGSNFAKGPVHVIISKDSDVLVLYWIRIIYIVMIIVVVGGMFLHNALDFIQKTKYRFAVRQGLIHPEHAGTRHYVRMTLNARLQHAATLISFILLAITGFMLKYPDAWWVVPFREMSGKFFAIRSLLHRIAAAVLMGVSFWHLFYLMSRHGRGFLRDMFPRLKDLADVWVNLGHLTGLSKRKPAFDRFGYPEKAEYWALIWGVIIMSATGLVMWFDNYFISRLTKLGWDIARTIHFYEAVLATLAIVVWHFYFVLLNPNVYPMSTTWLTGKISEHEMEEEHPLELERLHSEESGDDKK